LRPYELFLNKSFPAADKGDLNCGSQGLFEGRPRTP
jgi:hypothetical protein